MRNKPVHCITNPAQTNGLRPLGPDHHSRVDHAPVGHMNQLSMVTTPQTHWAASILSFAKVIDTTINSEFFFTIVLIIPVAGIKVDGSDQSFLLVLKLYKFDNGLSLRPPSRIHTIIFHKLANSHHSQGPLHRILSWIFKMGLQRTVRDTFTQDGVPVIFIATFCHEFGLERLHTALLKAPNRSLRQTSTPAARPTGVPATGMSPRWSLALLCPRTTRVLQAGGKLFGGLPLLKTPAATKLPRSPDGATCSILSTHRSARGLRAKLKSNPSDAPAPTREAWGTSSCKPQTSRAITSRVCSPMLENTYVETFYATTWMEEKIDVKGRQ